MSSEYLKKPILTKKMESTCAHGFAVTTCEMQGWRKGMEDAKIFTEIADNIYLFAVFDGHGGPEVAHYVSTLLPKELVKDPAFKTRNYAQALISVFRKIDDLIATDKGEEDLKTISKRLECTTASGERVGYRAGSTAIVIIITKDKYIVANLGDSRAVLSRNYTAFPLSHDHKPDLPAEKQRIQKAGGYVHNKRVNGTLGLSRSFGDFQLKHFSSRSYQQQAVISLPDIIQMERRPEDNFLIVGCDGIWEKFGDDSQKMISGLKHLRDKHTDRRTVMESLFNDLVAKDPKEIYGCDNMTAILIDFL